jgi:cephalosporin hydroxylase
MSIKNELKNLRNLLYERIYISRKEKKNVVDQFHKLYYDSFYFDQTWGKMSWLGVHIKKLPFDLWVYQEILFETKPDLIIECGTFKGGSAYYLASICDLINRGEILTIDIARYPEYPQHNRITYVNGSTLDTHVIDRVQQACAGKESVMVILDDDHTCDHVLNEMMIYNRFVSKGNYLIVEDSNINGHPVYPLSGPGPFEAISAFMKSNSDFEIDKGREMFYFSFNPNGYLKRVK